MSKLKIALRYRKIALKHEINELNKQTNIQKIKYKKFENF